jgi:hypothetical protein
MSAQCICQPGQLWKAALALAESERLLAHGRATWHILASGPYPSLEASV